MKQMETNHTKEVQSNGQLGQKQPGLDEVHVMEAEHRRYSPMNR